MTHFLPSRIGRLSLQVGLNHWWDLKHLLNPLIPPPTPVLCRATSRETRLCLVVLFLLFFFIFWTLGCFPPAYQLLFWWCLRSLYHVWSSSNHFHRDGSTNHVKGEKCFLASRCRINGFFLHPNCLLNIPMTIQGLYVLMLFLASSFLPSVETDLSLLISSSLHYTAEMKREWLFSLLHDSPTHPPPPSLLLLSTFYSRPIIINANRGGSDTGKCALPRFRGSDT